MPKCLRMPLVGLFIALAVAVPWLAVPRSVEGHVRDAETGRPLARATVKVGTQQLAADAEGHFAVAGVRGLASVWAIAAGYEPAHTSLPLGMLLGLQHELALDLKPTQVAGTVTDAATGQPVAGATVQAGQLEAQTDAAGRYVLKRLLPGDTIVARARYYQDSAPVAYQGQATADLSLALLPVTVQVSNLFTGEPLPAAQVAAGGQAVELDAQGRATLARLAPQTPITATLAGFAPATVPASPGDAIALKLRPNTLRGTVRNQEGQPLANALVLLRAPGEDPRPTYTNPAGEYQFDNVPADATLLVRMAGYARAERPLGTATSLDFQLQPFVAKGLYIPFGLLVRGVEENVQEDIDLVSRTEMNAVVIDIKGDRGYLAFKPTDPLLQQIAVTYEYIGDLHKVLDECKRRGLYTIARLVVFKDNVLAEARPQWAVHRGDGSLWRDTEGLAWADPFRKEVWEYDLAIAKEAAAMGFDEVQFDYVRFPSDGDIYDMEFSQETNRDARCQAISSFLAYVRKELDKTGVFFSVDLFGLVTSVDPNVRLGDLGIGQRLIDVAPWVDYISPMVYPSTYLPGHLGLPDPWRQPYEVVKISIDDAHKQVQTLIRPWLQHYSLWGVQYGPREFRLEKQAAADAHAWGWLFWNAGGVYDPLAFDPK